MNVNFAKILGAALACIMLAFFANPAFAGQARAIPPNMIGLMLTPTGFDGKIYEPGQVDIGDPGWFSGFGNKLVLLQRSGFAIKEQFTGAAANEDHEDHRCIVGPYREPMTLDVRLLFAMPDYSKPEGKDAILRMGLLGNPTPADATITGGDRTMLLSADSVYVQQVQQQVRGKIRDVCLSYESVDAVFDAVAKNGTPDGFTDKLKIAVGTVLAENNSPLFLVGAVASNVKPDSSVIDAIAASKAADELIDTMKKIDDFIKDDPSGMRTYIYKMATMKAIAARSGNTLLMTDVNNGASINVLPVPLK